MHGSSGAGTTESPRDESCPRGNGTQFLAAVAFQELVVQPVKLMALALIGP